ncbi:hypothetical protein KPH14_005976 [Odynerus spinipes]|uniref:Glucosylceramidase n=1 Tax=Odynerus spinipes TaxID=1348599 RepID=A0AAD9VP49_9HYME|nr:hypothetical protein KPH14_005976 [Odynerus spinipes]
MQQKQEPGRPSISHIPQSIAFNLLDEFTNSQNVYFKGSRHTTSSTMIYKTFLLVILFIWKAEGNDCVPRKFGYDSIVCVCNATYCDSTPNVEIPEEGNFNWYVSSREGLRLSLSKGKFSEGSHQPRENSDSAKDSENLHGIRITVNRGKTYQPIYGFGGAFTDSAGINIKSLSKKTQEMLLQSYFGREGSRYNLGRLPIGGSDFSTRLYTYDDVANDTALRYFQLAKEDIEYKIPLIRRAQELSPNLKLASAVWTPPLWMKTNNNYYGPSVLKKEHYETYAKYILKFLQAYKSHGIEVWAVSTGNEPNDAFVPKFKIPSLGWSPFELGNWLVNNFWPTITNTNCNETYLLALDDQRYLLTWYVDLLMSNRKAQDLIDGIAVHWYLDDFFSSEYLDNAHRNYPSKFLIMTEACTGFQMFDFPKVQLGSWTRGEHYVLDMIENMKHWVTGWIDWNLALDKKGGPNWIENYVDAAIIVDPETDEFFKQPTYYMIKHFSRFVERDSVRIDSSDLDDVKSIAFQTPSKTIVVVLYNRSSEDKNVVITDSKSGTIKINLAPYSIHTIQYK